MTTAITKTITVAVQADFRPFRRGMALNHLRLLEWRDECPPARGLGDRALRSVLAVSSRGRARLRARWYARELERIEADHEAALR